MTQPAAERRRSDRRQGDRRTGDRRRAEVRAADWVDADTLPTLPDGLVQPGAPATLSEGAQLRVQRTYAAARVVTGLGLVAAQVVLAVIGSAQPMLAVLVSMAYAVQAITLWLLPRYDLLADLGSGRTPVQRRRRSRRRWLVTIGVDLLCFGMLYLLSAQATFSFAALLVLPVLMAGVSMPRVMALGTAAAVTLFLLAVAWRVSLGEMEAAANQLLQAGLGGLGLFVIALLSGELAARLAREQEAARGSLELARQQVLINRLVIEEMADGVLVVDRAGQVRSLNPAARALLVAQGLAPTPPLSLHDQGAWAPLAVAGAQALDAGAWPEEGREIRLVYAEGASRTLRMRVRFIRGLGARGAAEEQLALLLLEDVRTAQERQRQEKLAAMGRVSAGVAHEIRNPLAAIAQANALLQEDELESTQRRLVRIMGDNIERLKRIVDDVMEVAPGGGAEPRTIDASALVATTTAEWAQMQGLPLGAESRLRVELPATPLGVLFDEEHLRRVLVNLLDNAGRHASPAAAAIWVRLLPEGEAGVLLSVASDSALIAADVERYLFEPFFSTRSRGTGLGLYICRELCQRNGAQIEYQARPEDSRWHNQFVVRMQRAALAQAEIVLPLNS